MSHRIKVVLTIWFVLWINFLVLFALGGGVSQVRELGDYPGTLHLITVATMVLAMLMTPVAVIGGAIGLFRWILGPRKVQIVQRG